MGINLNNLIYPYFVSSGVKKKEEAKSFPGVFRFSIDRLIRDIGETIVLGLNKILLFGIAGHKDSAGSGAYGENSIVALAVRKIKKEFPRLKVITDLCLCAYTDHGHCGVLNSGKSAIDNKNTLKALSNIALSHIQAGADLVAPSAMARGQVRAIRKALDRNGYGDKGIMGYSAKFNSSFYGPFRNAADCAPKFGDRSGYQLDYKDGREALRRIKEEIGFGAEIVMVKPALSYLDIISEAKRKFRHPLAAYNVSGEYALVKYGVRHKIWKEREAVREILSSIARSGADYIITYHAKDIARWRKKENYSI